MKLNKTVAKAVAFALAFSALPVAGVGLTKVFAQAPALTFNGNEGTLTTDEHGKFWGIAKLVKDAKKADLTVGGKHYKVSDVDDVIGTTIDLSFLSKGKSAIIAVGKEELSNDVKKNTKWAVKEITPGDKGFKVEYVADKSAYKKAKLTESTFGGDYGYLAVLSGGKTVKEINLNTDKEKVEVRQGNGDWKTVKDYFGENIDNDKVNKKLNVLSQRGANLVFRMKGDATSWPSKEAKVKIPAQSKAPTVKVDVTNETVSLKKGMLYLVKQHDEEATGAFSAADEKLKVSKKVTLTDIGAGAAVEENQYILLKSGASGKKIASKAVKIVVEKQTAPEAATTLTGGDADKTLGAQGGDLDKTRKVTFTLTTKYDLTKGAEIKNMAIDTDYEFYVSNKGTAPDTKTKWITLKRAKEEGAATTVKVKYSKDDKPNTYTDANSKIYLRKAGKKQVDNNVVIASAPLVVKLGLQNIAQQASVSKAGDNSVNSVTFNAKVDKDTTEYDFEVGISNLQKTGVAPKITDVKTTTIGKVAVKADKIEEGSTKSLITLKLPNKAFEKGIGGKVEFVVNIESVKQKITITFTEASAGGVGA